MHTTPPKPDQATVDHTASPDESVADSPSGKASLDFLRPAQSADELGRLGHYRILSILGKGGMGMVFLAEDAKLDRHVALKVMLPKFAEDKAAKQRFLREAKTAAKIEHDHIVHIYQVDEDRGIPFLAMQLLSGSSLEDVLKRAGRLKVPQILRLGAQIAEGLSIAHAKGLIHRDIKPANIWVEANYGGRVKILDFGLARSVQTDVGVTQSGVVLGTPAYMPPEQARGDTVDHRCDLYALGCVLYRMATGELPHKGKDTMALLMALALNEPTPPRTINGDIPEALNELILKLLAKEADKRPDSAKAVAQALWKMEQEPARTNQAIEVTAELTALAQAAVAPPPPSSTIPDPSNPFANLSGTAPPAREPASPPAAATVADSGGTDLHPGQTTQVVAAGRRRKYALAAVAAGLLVVTAVVIILVRRTPLVPVVPGQADWALEFDGNGTYVALPPMPFDPNKGLTLEAYLLPFLADEDQSIVHSGDQFGGFGLALHNNKEFGFGAGLMSEPRGPKGEAKWYIAASKSHVLLGSWVHVAAVFDGKTLRLFRDGREIADYVTKTADPGTLIHPGNATGTAFPGLARPPAAPTHLGANTNKAWFFKGRMTAVRISNGPRYASNFTPEKSLQSDQATLALYRFDEGQGETLTDSSGNDHHGKIVGAKWVKVDAAPVAAAANSALHFEAVGDRVGQWGIPYIGKEPITLEAWFKRTGPGIGPLVSLYGDVPTLMLGRNDDKFTFYVDPGAKVINVGSRGDAWVHVAGVWDGRTSKLYVDGKQVGKAEPNPSSMKKEEVTSLLMGGNSARPLGGMIDEVRISKGVRYSADFTPRRHLVGDKDTLAVYHFDEGQGDKLIDSSGNGYHGKIVGAKWVRIDTGGTAVATAKTGLRLGPADHVIFADDEFKLASMDQFTIEAVATCEGEPPTERAGLFGSLNQLGLHYLPGRGGWQLTSKDSLDENPSGAAPWSGQTSHFAAVRDRGQLRLYVNGRLSSTGTLKGQVLPATKGPFAIGGRLDLGPKNKGAAVLLHAFRVSRTARYHQSFSPLSRFEMDKDTIAFYRCDEGQGEELKDSSGNNHHGKINGAKWVKVDETIKTKGSPDAEQRLAQNILSRGGKVSVRLAGQVQVMEWMEDESALPPAPFQVVGVKLGPRVTPNDLAQATNIETLYLSRAGQADDFLAVAPKLPKLREIWSHQAGVTDAGLKHLQGLDLTALEFFATKVQGPGLAHLAGHKKLNRLVLGYTPLDDSAVEYIKPHRQLRQLRLEGTKVSVTNVVALAAALPDCTIWSNFGTFTPGSTPPSPTTLQKIYQLGGQVQIEIGGGKQTFETLQAAQAQAQRLYAVLFEGSATLRDQDLTLLAEATGIQELNLRSTAIGNAGLEHVKRLDALRLIDLKKTQVSAAGVASLSDALPGCRIEWDEGVFVPKKKTKKKQGS